MPHLEALGTAVPGPPVPQSALKEKAVDVLREVAPELVEKLDVFDTVGIRKRHFARPIDWYLESHGWRDRNLVYAEVGVDLLEEATRAALARADLPPAAIDGIVLVSTTGIATPSLDARLANRMGLRADATRLPVFGLGCAGGVAGVRIAADLVRANPEKRYLLVALELCSLAFDLTDMDVRSFVATTLFADGCAAAIIRGDEVEGGSLGRIGATASHQWRDSEDVMGWDVADEGLRVVFSRRIPDIVATKLRPIVDAFLKEDGTAPNGYAFHPGGTKVLEAYETALDLAPQALDTARAALREYGNMSSPTVLFALDDALRRRALEPGDATLLAALGPGFTSELALLHG